MTTSFVNCLFMFFISLYLVDCGHYPVVEEKICKNNLTTNSTMVALILARGGSKGIPLKNLAKLQGISLLGRSLAIIQSINLFDEIWVSTDHQLIAEAVEKYNVHIHWRPTSVSLDTTTSIESVQEFLQHHPHISKIALIQVTSVFLKPKYLKEAFCLFQYFDCVFSVTRSYKLRWNRSEQPDRSLIPINFNPKHRPRRQDWSGELLETGMFYFATRHLLNSGLFQNDNCNVVEIPQQDSLEIDTLADLELAECLLA